MSFFDDEPTRAAPRAGRPAPRPRPAGAGARRPAPRGGGSGGGGARRPPRGGAVDDQQLLIRRLVAGGAGLLVLILLVLGINGCLNGRKDRALKDYSRNVANLMGTTQTDVSTQFFQLLNSGADDPSQLQASVRQSAVAAQEAVATANGFSVPDQMIRAQSALMLVLHLRSTSISKIADQIAATQAKGRDRAGSVETALSRIAGQMRAFDASDVIYSQRVRPYITEALKAQGVSGADLPSGQFLPDLGWLEKDKIAGVLNAQRAQGGTGANPKPASGTHGHGLLSVSLGTTTLSPQPAINHLARGRASFAVKIANQGENDESEVVVRITVKAAGSKAIVASTTLPGTKAGSESTATVTIPNPPSQPANLTAEVLPVPGEKMTDNNKSTYTVYFDG